MNIIKDVYYSNLSKLDIYIPDNLNKKTIIYFHGGGLTSGSKDDAMYIDIANNFAKFGFIVFNVDYPLYPNTKFPLFINECAKAVKYCFDNVVKFGGDINNIFLCGQSAGAYITLMLCFNKSYLLSEGINPKNIKGFISDAGQPTDHFHILECEDNLNPLMQRISIKAPLYYIDDKIESSPILLFAYQYDLPNRVEQNQLLVSSIKNFNKDINISLQILKGGHCQGSTSKDKDDNYPTIIKTIDWINKL